jgi:hypothetical protein
MTYWRYYWYLPEELRKIRKYLSKNSWYSYRYLVLHICRVKMKIFAASPTISAKVLRRTVQCTPPLSYYIRSQSREITLGFIKCGLCGALVNIICYIAVTQECCRSGHSCDTKRLRLPPRHCSCCNVLLSNYEKKQFTVTRVFSRKRNKRCKQSRESCDHIWWKENVSFSSDVLH